MIKVFKSELYYMVHSRVVWVFMVLMTLFSVSTVSIGAKYHHPVERVYFVTGAKDMELERSLEQAMGPEWDQFVRYNERISEYQMNLDKYKLMRDLGQCPYLFERSDFLYCYEIPPERYPLDAQDIYEGWAVTGIFSDIDGSIFFWMFFAAFFFGRVHTRRGYTAGILCGVKRRDLILGRILVYVLVSVLMSCIQTLLAFALFAPRVPEIYGAAVMARGLAARLAIDLFFCGLVMVFPVLIRRPVLSFIVSYGAVAFFLSNRAVIRLPVPVFRLYEKALDCIVTGEGFGAACIPLAACMVAVFAATGIASVLYIGRAELK